MSEQKKEYEPFGSEWKFEMMGWTKKDMVETYADVGKQKVMADLIIQAIHLMENVPEEMEKAVDRYMAKYHPEKTEAPVEKKEG